MKLGNKIKNISKIHEGSFSVCVEFNDGFKGVLDLSFIFGTRKKKPLVNEILRGNLFSKCFVEGGSLAWPNGYELCPDAIYQWIKEENKKIAS